MKFFVSFFLILFGCAVSLACTCIPNKTAKDYIQDANAVFVGKIVSINEQSEPRSEFGRRTVVPLSDAKVKVLQAWKGIKDSTITIEVETNSTCNDGLESGETFLIFAYGESLLDGAKCPRLHVSIDDIKKELGEGKTFEHHETLTLGDF